MSTRKTRLKNAHGRLSYEPGGGLIKIRTNEESREMRLEFPNKEMYVKFYDFATENYDRYRIYQDHQGFSFPKKSAAFVGTSIAASLGLIMLVAHPLGIISASAFICPGYMHGKSIYNWFRNRR